MKIGDKLQILCKDYASKQNGKRVTLRGRIVYINEHYFTLQVEKNGKDIYRESFLNKDSDLKIREIKHGVLDRRSVQAI